MNSTNYKYPACNSHYTSWPNIPQIDDMASSLISLFNNVLHGTGIVFYRSDVKIWKTGNDGETGNERAPNTEEY